MILCIFFLNQAKGLRVFFSTILCIYIVYFLDKDILIYDIFFLKYAKDLRIIILRRRV